MVGWEVCVEIGGKVGVATGTGLVDEAAGCPVGISEGETVGAVGVDVGCAVGVADGRGVVGADGGVGAVGHLDGTGVGTKKQSEASVCGEGEGDGAAVESEKKEQAFVRG